MNKNSISNSRYYSDLIMSDSCITPSIIPLTGYYLAQAIKLVNASFRDEETEPGMELLASLHDQGLADYSQTGHF